MRRTPYVLAAGAVSLAVMLAACGNSTAAPSSAADSPPTSSASAEPSGAPTRKSDSAQTEAKPGGYLDWADYDKDPGAYADTDVVLFFHAPWCPDCNATEESLNRDGVPDGLTVVKVDFDSSTDLRQKYGVTVQHTFVLIEPDGNQVEIWTGTRTGEAIAAQIS